MAEDLEPKFRRHTVSDGDHGVGDEWFLHV